MMLFTRKYGGAYLSAFVRPLLFPSRYLQSNENKPKENKSNSQRQQFIKRLAVNKQKWNFRHSHMAKDRKPFEKSQQNQQLNFSIGQSNISKSLYSIFGMWSAVFAFIFLFYQLTKNDKSQLTCEQIYNMVSNETVTSINIVTYKKYNDSILSIAQVNTPEGIKKAIIGYPQTFKKRIQQLHANKYTKVNIKQEVRMTLLQQIGVFTDMTGSFVSIMLIVVIAVGLSKIFKKNMNIDIMSQNKKTFRVIKGENLKVKFSDVAGLNDAKLEITEFVDFLKNPDSYKQLGARIPKGALLSGPPGTGKTMLAKACAGQAGVPFFAMSGSEFVEVFVGVGASRVRQLFAQAKKQTPSIIFIDQIDAIGQKRDERGGHSQRANTLNQLLVQMDGFGTSQQVIVLAATNRRDSLDSALTRPGRFDRSIQITLPDLQGRKQIFLIHLKPLKLSPQKTIQEYAKRLATLSPGFSGADIYNICNEAAILSARHNKQYVQSIDFEMATQRIIGGVEKKKIITEQERRIISYHQCGHAVISWFLEGADPLLKLTIIPRSKGALGFAQYLPSQTNLKTLQELIDRVCVILGGRCSQQYFFKKVTTGAYDDLQKVHSIIRSLIVNYGMSKKIGYIGYMQNEYTKNFSEDINQLIDEQIKVIAKQCTQRTQELVKKYHKQIDDLAKKLLQKETLDSNDIRAVLGERPFQPKSNYKQFLQESKQI